MAYLDFEVSFTHILIQNRINLIKLIKNSVLISSSCGVIICISIIINVLHLTTNPIYYIWGWWLIIHGMDIILLYISNQL